MHKIILLLIMTATLAVTADIEEITTTDGKRLVGYYNPKTERLLLTHHDTSRDGALAASRLVGTIINVPAGSIAERRPFKNAEDPMLRTREELRKLEADRQKHLSAANDARKTATTSDKAQANQLLTVAKEYEKQAETLSKVITYLETQVKAFDAAKEEVIKGLPPPSNP